MVISLQPIVYIVDDVVDWQEIIQDLLDGIGARFQAFTSAQAFLDAYRPSPCECLICDLRMPDLGGLEVQNALLAAGSSLPIIFFSGFSEVSTAVQAIKVGAFDFLVKGEQNALLVGKVQAALRHSRELHQRRQAEAGREARLALLTDKEREVAQLVASGLSSREIADRLGLSPRTVENHRARLMQKLHADSIVDLVRLFP